LDGLTNLTGDYNLQLATINGSHTVEGVLVDGPAAFTIHNASVGVERTVLPSLKVFGAFGFSRLEGSEVGPTRTGPAWHVGASQVLRRASVDASYNRAYVPAFGFGGTQQNEQLTSRVRVPLGRRLYSQASLIWSRNEPLTRGELRLKSTWFAASAGYIVQPWMSVEAFFDATRQEIDRPGGQFHRSRFGFQVITAKPMRIR
jgi:hypothetical protein